MKIAVENMKNSAVFKHINNNNNKILTIVIPTYNREKRLLNQLRSIFLQPEYKDVEIVILDNHSDYDIATSLKDHFSPKELSNVELIRNPFNIGIDGNLSNSFMFCKTKYMWLLSDDDETLIDSIKAILLNIENNKDIAIFKYSIANFFPEEDKTISSIAEFIDYYRSGIHSSGTMIYISNNIFNMELLSPFIQNVFTPFNFFMLIFSSLSTKAFKMKFCPQSIVSYISPDAGSEWDFIPMLIRVSTFDKFAMSILHKNDDFVLTKRQVVELGLLIARNFPQRKLLLDLLKIRDLWKRKYIYNKLFFDVLIHGARYHWMYFFLFHLFNIINIDNVKLSSMIKKIKDVIKKIKSKI
jgi:GT2 family glycosyltransferase